MKIKRVGSKVEIMVDTGLPVEAPWAGFEFARGNEFDAALLEKHIRDLLWAKMQAIRKEAYERGWKTRASKKPKETWFSGELP